MGKIGYALLVSALLEIVSTKLGDKTRNVVSLKPIEKYGKTFGKVEIGSIGKNRVGIGRKFLK